MNQGILPQQANVQYQINKQSSTFLDDEEFNLNVDDIDLKVRPWSQLIASIIKFFKRALLQKSFTQQVIYIFLLLITMYIGH